VAIGIAQHALPHEPLEARRSGEQVVFREAFGSGEFERAGADEKHVIGIEHDALRHLRRRLDILQRADGAHAAGGSVDTTGVEFDDAIFVGKAAIADAIVARVEFDDVDALDDGVEGVAAGLHHFDGFGDNIEATVIAVALETAMNLGRGWDWTIWMAGSAVAPRIAARRVMGMGLPLGRNIMSQGEGALG
jgi:hypothetical protein